MPRKYQLLADGRIRASLTFDGGLTARGTETRRHKVKSRAPHSSLASKSISTQGHWMREAMQGNEASLAKLTNWLAALVQEHGKAMGWPLNGRHDAVAQIVLGLYIDDPEDALSGKECARKLGVSPASYSKDWRPRIERSECMQWVKVWYMEALKS